MSMLVTTPVAVASKCQEVIAPWWQWHPPIGVFIALLAVVGVLVPWFRGGETGRGEKAFWTFLMFLFVGLEIRTIYLDQTQHDREQALARCQQLESFQRIANGIDTAISNSSAQFEATMSKFKETINNETGGDSYVVFTPGLISEVPPGTPGIQNGTLVMSLGIPILKGKFPLHSVSVLLADHTGSYTVDYGSVFPHEIGRVRQGLEVKFSSSVKQTSGWLYITCSNGSYFENVIAFKVGSEWASAVRLYKGGDAKGPLIYSWRSPNSPHNIPEDMWNWHK